MSSRGEVDRLWKQVKPLYDELHCYVRAKLARSTATTWCRRDGPIRADLLGNMWAQQWGNIYDVVGAAAAGAPAIDLDRAC